MKGSCTIMFGFVTFVTSLCHVHVVLRTNVSRMCLFRIVCITPYVRRWSAAPKVRLCLLQGSRPYSPWGDVCRHVSCCSWRGSAGLCCLYDRQLGNYGADVPRQSNFDAGVFNDLEASVICSKPTIIKYSCSFITMYECYT